MKRKGDAMKDGVMDLVQGAVDHLLKQISNDLGVEVYSIQTGGGIIVRFKYRGCQEKLCFMIDMNGEDEPHSFRIYYVPFNARRLLRQGVVDGYCFSPRSIMVAFENEETMKAGLMFVVDEWYSTCVLGKETYMYGGSLYEHEART